MTTLPAATVEQQKYLDKAAYYVGRAMRCYGYELWPEALSNFGSALESLLRIRYGSGGKLFQLIEKFDADDLFSDLEQHRGDFQECLTCSADRTRILRNAVHPDCWIEATKSDVTDAGILVVAIYHALVVCESKVAVFQDSPEPTLRGMERSQFPFSEATSKSEPATPC